MLTYKEIIDSLEQEKSSIEKELNNNNKRINLLQIELTQLKYQNQIRKEKIKNINSELYAYKNVRNFNKK